MRYLTLAFLAMMALGATGCRQTLQLKEDLKLLQAQNRMLADKIARCSAENKFMRKHAFPGWVEQMEKDLDKK